MNLATSSTRRGFTLIELLVVIAIIGILSAVVLASLNTARTKGTDAAIKSNLVTIQTQAELYYDSNSNTYGTAGAGTANALCTAAGIAGMFTDTTIKAAVTAASTAFGGTAYANSRCAIGSVNSSTSYAVAHKLKNTTNKWWCVDSTGVSREVTVATDPIALGGNAAAAACPADT